MLSKGRLSRCCLMAFLEQRKPRFSVFRFSGSLRHPGPPEARAQLGRVGGASSRQIAKLGNCASPYLSWGAGAEMTGLSGGYGNDRLRNDRTFTTWKKPVILPISLGAILRTGKKHS